MHNLPALISDLALIMICAGLITIIFKKLKQPVVLGYILSGILVGPHIMLTPTTIDKENIQIWADIGVIFLLFSLGLEFSFKKIVNVGKSAIITASTNILFMLIIGYNVGLNLGWSTTESLFLGGMISMSSTTIIIKAFDELNLKAEKFTDLVFGVLVVEDVVGILLLVLLPAISIGKNVSGIEVLTSAGKLVFFLILWFITGVYLVPTFLKKVIHLLNDELLLLVSIALCLGMVLVASSVGFSSALGAFIMGSILSEADEAERIEKLIRPIKDLFGAVFFVSVGMLVDPNMFVEYIVPITIITIVVMLGKVILSVAGFLLSGNRLETSIHGGFSLAQVGEFAFIIAAAGMSIGVLGDYVYPIIVAVSVVTTFTTPLMIKAASPAYSIVYRRLLPASWKSYLSAHTTSKKDTNEEEELWIQLFKKYFFKLCIASVILIAIINLSFYFLAPFVKKYTHPQAADFITTIITLAAMSPFLQGLLSVNSDLARIYLTLWNKRLTNRLPLILCTVLRLAIIIIFIMVVINHLLTKNFYITYALVGIMIAIIYKSSWLSKSYKHIERQFLSNLYRHKDKEKDKDAAPTEKEETKTDE
ncbi:MAG: cation:proton antiporter [Alphaproteobacteria bacterium]|nr:cation:proton antiporter [Alphaproteobacteria bacterium]